MTHVCDPHYRGLFGSIDFFNKNWFLAIVSKNWFLKKLGGGIWRLFSKS
jgi:hypothetical protein